MGKLTEQEKRIVAKIGHPLYTVEFLEEWINRTDNVFVNAPAALQAMGAKGFYEAVQEMNSAGGQQETEVCKMCEAYMADTECDLKESCPAAGIVKKLKEAEEIVRQQKKDIREKNRTIRDLKKQVTDLRIEKSYMINPNAIGDRHEMGG